MQQTASQLQRRLAAVLIADVAGYSRLMQLDEEGTHRRWQPYLQRALVLIAEQGGQLVKTTGDGFVAAFPSVVAAGRAALAWLAEIDAAETAIEPARRIGVRVGLHLGDVIVGGEGGGADLFGDGVNIAARLEQRATPGAVCLDEATRQHLLGKIEGSFEDLGQQRLKNIVEPLHLWLLRPGPTGPRPLRARAAWVAVALMIAMSGATLWAYRGGLPSAPTAPAAGRQAAAVSRLSIVVLPFVNVSGNADEDVFADALTEDLISDLSRISDAFVISPSTSLTFKGKPGSAEEVARQLGVAYALSGTVRREGDAVRVSASLIDARTGGVLWSERYDRTRADVYALQQQLTGQIARTLNLELKDAASRRVLRGKPSDLDAQDYALRAWAELWTKPQSKGTNDAALGFVDKALALDPDNADALASKCYALARAARYGWLPGETQALAAAAIAAGERAIALDPRDADAFFVLAFASAIQGNLDRSLYLYKRAQELNPNHAPAFANYGFALVLAGRPAEAQAWIDKARAISPRDPLAPIWLSVSALAASLTGDDKASLEAAERAIALNPNHPPPYLYAAVALDRMGRAAEAAQMMKRHARARPDWTITKQKEATGGSPAFDAMAEDMLARLRKLGLPEA